MFLNYEHLVMTSFQTHFNLYLKKNLITLLPYCTIYRQKNPMLLILQNVRTELSTFFNHCN